MNEAKAVTNKPDLHVYFENELVGQIAINDEAKLRFAYAKSWLENKKSFPISVSIPLVERVIDGGVSNNFFVNLLPEERIRKRTCEKLGISEGNNYELLRRIGGDCAGALTIVEEGKQPPKSRNVYKQITKEQLAGWSKGDQYAFAEVTGDEDVRLSLAGAQDKLPVTFDGKDFYLPKGNSPSTHILKFASHFSHLPENETFTTMLAKAAGVETVDIVLFQTSKSRIAVVKRYDRIERDGSYTRIHQEDFCQALGMHPNEKYQQEGGPSLKQCIDLIKNVCSVPVVELEKVIRWTMFNWLVYNADAHAKNISLLFVDGNTIIAPFYDLVCTNNYPQLNKRLAMRGAIRFMRRLTR
ncbi:MAG: type II toxin-antitoxin system HipA family toxin [Planctomycetota bacterium]